jgi:glucosamine--fructose-6-phosphate aminotransferase (isomerizing)
LKKDWTGFSRRDAGASHGRIPSRCEPLLALPQLPLTLGNAVIAIHEEIRARCGPTYVVTHPGELPVAVDGVVEVPRSEPELDPILLTIPLQLLAYRVALARGTETGQPRNLAKSVTVE